MMIIRPVLWVALIVGLGGVVSIATANESPAATGGGTRGTADPREEQYLRMPAQMRDELRAIMEDPQYSSGEERMEARRAWREKHREFLEARREYLIERSEEQRRQPVERRPFVRRELPEDMDPELRAIMEKRFDVRESREAWLDQRGGPSMTEDERMELLREWHSENREMMEDMRTMMQAYSDRMADTPDESGVSPNQRMEWRRDPSKAPAEFRQIMEGRRAMREAALAAETDEQRHEIVKQYMEAERERRRKAAERRGGEGE